MDTSRRWRAAVLGTVYALYVLGVVFSEYWLGGIKQTEVVQDFVIYYDAFTDARDGGNPYQPYDIGHSFVYHPFALTFVGLFSYPNQLTALILWVTLSAALWIAAFDLSQRIIRGALPSLRRRSQLKVVILWVLPFFAPFVETLHIGQINVFVIVCLYLAYFLAEHDRQIGAGIALALAVTLKTTPALFVLYFAVQRQYRAAASSVIALAVLTLIPVIQFSPGVLRDYLEIVPEIGGEIHPTIYNQSALALAYRAAQWAGWDDPRAGLLLAHKALLAGAVLALLGTSYARRGETPTGRLWLFNALLLVMIVSSPLLWYHHSTFLLLPLLALIAQRETRPAALGIALLLVIQLERLFEYGVIEAALPVLAAHAVLIAAVVRAYGRSQPARVV